MDYLKHYTNLITKAQSRTLEGYKERHHIVPRCLGGSDEPDNLVDLTPEEHYIAHLLLVKIYPGKGKLVFAANMMCVDAHGNRSNNKRHGWLKRELSKHLSEAAKARKPVSEETRKKMSAKSSGKNNSMYGLKGADHPAYGVKPWRTKTSLKSNQDWKYSLAIYDYYIQDTQYNPFNKKVGHKRIVKDLGLPESAPIRAIIEKITMNGWNPYTEDDLFVWIKENSYETKIDISEFKYPKAFKYAFEIYDWAKTKQSSRGSKFTQLFKDRPDLKNLPGIPSSNIVYLLETKIQKEQWNPYVDTEFNDWILKWHS